MIDRRKFLGCAGALLLPPTWLPAAPARRPNILLLIADDWSYPHAGALGDPVVKTPTFDRIVRDGVLFRNAFVTAPSCTPSRAALATGQHPWRLEGSANLWGSLPKGVSTYQDLLRRAGYFAGYSAKGIAPTNNIHRDTDPCGKRFRNFASFAKAQPKGAPWTFYVGLQDGQFVGAAFESVSPKGYGGDVGIMVGVNADGQVQGIEILVQKETPGLGAKMADDAFKSQFSGRSIAETRWAVDKDQGDIDSITAATISSRAVVEAVHAGLQVYTTHQARIVK